MTKQKHRNKSAAERAAKLKRIQEQVRKFVPEGVSLVDELIAERRREAAKEAQEDSGNASIAVRSEITKSGCE